MISFERHFEDYFYDDFCDSEDGVDRIAMAQALGRAAANPEEDFFQECTPEKPKIAIGEYVASQGFNVPMVQSLEEWQKVFDDDLAFIRSENRDDYAGMSGLMRSKRVGRDLIMPKYSNEDSFSYRYWDLVCEGLRGGDFRLDEYMKLFVWADSVRYRQIEAGRCRVPVDLAYGTSTSAWRYIPGNNIRIFRDPNIESKYYLGVHPDQGYVMGYELEGDELEQNIEHERFKQPIDVKRLVDFYEQIRILPLFDTTQAPLLEVQQSEDDELYFLQYFKTGQKIAPTVLFDLPSGDNIIRAENVRGVTRPEGEKMRMYLSPNFYSPDMDKQGFYFDMIYSKLLLEQYLCKIGRVAVHEAYISLKDNHFISAPLFRPQVGIGLYKTHDDEQIKRLRHITRDYYHEYDVNPYMDVIVTSNGREATIESDWQVQESK